MLKKVFCGYSSLSAAIKIRQAIYAEAPKAALPLTIWEYLGKGTACRVSSRPCSLSAEAPIETVRPLWGQYRLLPSIMGGGSLPTRCLFFSSIYVTCASEPVAG
jgi:hypothetical protein